MLSCLHTILCSAQLGVLSDGCLPHCIAHIYKAMSHAMLRYWLPVEEQYQMLRCWALTDFRLVDISSEQDVVFAGQLSAAESVL